MREKYPEWNCCHSIKFRPFQFARLLAKIAYGYVVAEWGYGAFSPFGIDVILGRSDDCFHTVGGMHASADPIPGGDHITDINLNIVSKDRILITTNIRLFSQISTPTYVVVVGEINIQNGQHLRALTKHIANGKIPNPFLGSA